MNRLNDHLILHIFTMLNTFYDIIKLSTVNKYIYEYFKYNRTYIFSIKFATDLLFVDSFYSYFLDFTGSINNKVNTLINRYNDKIQKVLSVIPINKYCEELKLAQLEFIQNIKYNINHKCVYQLLFCPSYILFRNIPAIEHWYLIVLRHNRIYSILNAHFFDILKYHFINLNKSHPLCLKSVMTLNIEIGNVGSDFYERLLNVFNEVNPQLFKNVLYDVLCKNIKKRSINTDNQSLDNFYDNYIDFTTDEIKYLYTHYNLNDCITDSSCLNELHKVFRLIKC